MASIPSSHRDLLEARGTALFTTLGPNGDPQTTAVWYFLDGDEVKLSLNETRQKSKNLQRDPRAVLFLIDTVSPYHTLEIRAVAELVVDERRELAGVLGTKYGLDLRTRDQPGERRFAVTLRPTKVNANG